MENLALRTDANPSCEGQSGFRGVEEGIPWRLNLARRSVDDDAHAQQARTGLGGNKEKEFDR